VLLVALALGCAHRSEANGRDASNDPWPLVGDELLWIRDARDVVGRYRNVVGSPGPLTITAEAGQLFMEIPHERYVVAIRENGTLAVRGHFGARLLRRGGRTLLSVSWAYAFGLYERTDQP
jgi:hypothetical protein